MRHQAFPLSSGSYGASLFPYSSGALSMPSDDGSHQRLHGGDNRSAPAAAFSHGALGRNERESCEIPKPKRPLSSYNIFFHHERQKILDQTPARTEGKPKRSHGKIGFADLARSIAAKWKVISKEDRAVFSQKAAEDKIRYQREMEVWRRHQQQMQPDAEVGQIEAPPLAPLDPVAAARMPEPLVRRPSPDSSYHDNDPIETSWHAAVIVQNPLPFHLPSAAPHPVAAFERDFDEDEGESKISAEWLSLHSLVSTNHLQMLPAPAVAPAMPQQIQHAAFEPFTLSQPPMDAATAAVRPRQEQQSPNPEEHAGMESLAQNLDDESTDLFLSMFRRRG